MSRDYFPPTRRTFLGATSGLVLGSRLTAAQSPKVQDPEPAPKRGGTMTFVVSVTDPGGLSDTATLNIVVTAAPPIVSTISLQGGSVLLNWSGGVAPYQVQSAPNLANPDWQNVGGAINGTTLSVAPTNSATFYRIVGQ